MFFNILKKIKAFMDEGHFYIRGLKIDYSAVIGILVYLTVCWYVWFVL